MTKVFALVGLAGILSAQTIANLEPQAASVSAIATPIAAVKPEPSAVKRVTVKGIITAASIQVENAGSTEYLQLACIDTDSSNTDGSSALRRLIEGKLIEYSRVDRDTVEVGLDGTNINLHLLRHGLAKLTVSDQCHHNQDYNSAAAEAKLAKAGIFADPVPEVKVDMSRFAPDEPARPSFGKLLLGMAVSGLAEGLVESAFQRRVYVPSFSDDVLVRGYYRKNGTYVAPHHRTRPNGTKADNYSTKGNTNPHTGRRGTK